MQLRKNDKMPSRHRRQHALNSLVHALTEKIDSCLDFLKYLSDVKMDLFECNRNSELWFLKMPLPRTVSSGS